MKYGGHASTGLNFLWKNDRCAGPTQVARQTLLREILAQRHMAGRQVLRYPDEIAAGHGLKGEAVMFAAAYR